MTKRPVYALVCVFLIGVSLCGCSLKKNTAASRKYTAFITRYNIYFNGDEHYRQTLSELESKYADDFTRTTLFMHPAEAYADESAPQPTADFKRSIEKAQKAIQLRSIKKRPQRKGGKSTEEKKRWMKREEYNPFLHNAWMMMGRSQYMGGDFLGAASTFHYISRHFWWLPQTVTEAKLWQARSYLAIDWLFEAQTILQSVKEKELLPYPALQNLYDFDMTSLKVRSREYAEAIPYLQSAVKGTKGAQKARLTFLLGQLYQLTSHPAEAYAAYKKVGSMSSLDYRTRFNARIRQSEVYSGADIQPEVRSLRSLTRYGANKEYLDQIYYAIANLYLSRGDTLQAMENYTKAVNLSTRKGIESAQAQLALGRLYYAQGKYDKAQPHYSTASSQLPETYPDHKAIRRRADVLDELAVYAQNVTLQDSLLRLAAMSPDEQRKVVDKIIADLKKREKEEADAAAREEYLAKQGAAGTGLNQTGAAPATFAMNTDKSWYFYNEATRNAGRTDFQKRWGSRKLEDDWRRRNKASFSTFGAENTEDPYGTDEETGLPADSASTPEGGTPVSPESMQRASDPHFPEYYLRQIPSTDAERANAHEIIQEGLYNMGLILKDKMQDYGAAEAELTRLIDRYPDNAYRLDAYYNLYLMHMLAAETAQAEHYRACILREFPDSPYGKALLDPDYMTNLRRMPEVEDSLYEAAYAAYLATDNPTLHTIYRRVRKDFPMTRIMPKFMFLEALSYVSENNTQLFDSILTELAERYPDTDVAPLASSYLKLLHEGRKFNTSDQNVRSMQWSVRLSTDSATLSTAPEPAKFTFRTDTAMVVALIYTTPPVNPRQLLFDVARHNFNTYSVRDFDLDQLSFSTLGIITVSGFADIKEAAAYRSALESSTLFTLPKGVIPLVIAKEDLDIMLHEGRSLQEYFDAAGDDRLRRVHEDVLPAEQFDEPVIPPAPLPSPEQTEPSPSPEPEPEPKPMPQTPATPTPLPDIPTGSEGDDPLLDI